MSVSKIKFFVDSLREDIKNKDPWVIPQKISM
jgi:hypothetical protein